MTELTHNDVLDGMLDVIINNANLMTICSVAPARPFIRLVVRL